MTTQLEVRLSSEALDPLDVSVGAVVVREALSRPFEIEVDLTIGDGTPDLDACVGQPIRVRVVQGDDVLRTIAGVVASADDLLTSDASGHHAAYALRIVPRLQLLSLNERLQVFREKSVPDIVRVVLERAGLKADQDFVLDLDRRYPVREFVVQYRESDLDFVTRLTEQVGITYFFTEDSGRDVVHFVDEDVGVDLSTSLVHDERREGFGVHRLRRSLRAIPRSVRVDDYDYNRPMLALAAAAAIPGGVGDEVYEYGPNYVTPDEGQHLAHVRAEELRARRDVYEGTCSYPVLFAGARAAVEGTARGDLKLLVTEIEGRFDVRASADAQGHVYDAEFRAIPREVAFRPARRTPRPRVHGMLTGVIDAEHKGEYASLDEHGRYRVKLLFDASGLKDGHASLPLRMAQSHAGQGYGMHFPLRPGVEVLIAFVDGDPDRPVIAGCVPNPLTPSPVNQQNGTKNVIRTGSNNEIHLDDQKGGERIKLSTPRHSSVLQMGARNAPEEGIHLATEANFTSITKSVSAGVSTGSSLLSARQALVTGDMFSLAGKTIPERIKAIMEMGEAVTELLESLAEVGLSTATEPTKALLSAEVEKATKARDEAADDYQKAKESGADDAEDKKTDLDEKQERLEKLEEAEERLDQASEAAENTVGLAAGAATGATKLVSFVCDLFVEILKKKALAENLGLWMSSLGNTVVAGGRPDLGAKLESPFNLVGSDGSAILSGEKAAFVYGENATVFGAETATLGSETTTVAGVKQVELTSKEKIWLHTTPAQIQLMPETGITLQPSPGNVILFSPEGELDVTADAAITMEAPELSIEAPEIAIEATALEIAAEGAVEIAAGSMAVEAAAGVELTAETSSVSLLPAGASMAYAETTLVKTDASGVTLQPAPGNELIFAPAGTLTVTAVGAVSMTSAMNVTISGATILIG